MSRLRFTLAQLMGVVIFIGLGFAAMRSATLLWSSMVFTLTVAVLTAAILGAMARRGRARMMWAGFALFGWIYLSTTFWPWAAGNGVTAPPYVTRWALDYWDAKLWDPTKAPVVRIDTAGPGELLYQRNQPGWSPAPFVTFPDSLQFRRIGQCFATILFGFVGALLGRLLAVKDDRPSP
jgi:hypothetical protein